MAKQDLTKAEKKDLKKKSKISLKDFWDFFKNTPALGLAIGVVMAEAVSSLVTSIVKGVLTPVITLLIPDEGFTSFNYEVSGVTFRFGDVISGIINFFLISLIIYLLVKGILRNEKLLKYARVKKAKIKKSK